jgi:hypothetical protein
VRHVELIDSQASTFCVCVQAAEVWRRAGMHFIIVAYEMKLEGPRNLGETCAILMEQRTQNVRVYAVTVWTRSQAHVLYILLAEAAQATLLNRE